MALHQEGDKLQQLSDGSQQSFHPPSEAPQVRGGQQHLEMGGYTLAGIYLGLRDYVASTLHLRAALHIQPTFSHALSALKLLRCSLKFKEEQGFLKRKVQPCV